MVKNYNVDTKNTLSKLYKILQDNIETQDIIRLKWNSELGGQLGLEDWTSTYKAIHKTTNSRYCRESSWNMHKILYYTKNTVKICSVCQA